jgi:dihydropyrimidinase
VQVAAQYVMSPPIRNAEHQKQIVDGLAGGILGVIATDHCPFNSTQKRRGLHDFRNIPNGVNGIEERLHVTWDKLVNSGARTGAQLK